jgi:hypothetical protein
MKKIFIVTLVALAMLMGIKARSFASDWDKAGKVLTVIEGVRVVTGGRVDIIGTMTGINKSREYARRDEGPREYGRAGKYEYPRYYGYQRRYQRSHEYPRSFGYAKRVWVPCLVWKEEFVPKHIENRPGYGPIEVEGHFVRYQVEEGGHWEIVDECG